MLSPSPEPERLVCAVCGSETAATRAKRARVHSNVKRFSAESFELWQCGQCGSIHAVGEVDLAHYYAHYPFHAQKLSLPARLAFAGKLRALEQLGLSRSQRVLDYGCGGGSFVQYLAERGYTGVSGYDSYVHEGPYAAKPQGPYDALLSQDVIEHVDSPREHLETLRSLARPGSLIVIGTPNAEVVDLEHPQPFVHMLHQPYHRHILSFTALTRLAGALGLELLAVRHGFPGSSAFPGLNSRYLRRVLRANGEVLDEVLAGKVPLKPELFTPAALFDMLTGAFRDPGYDMTVAFRVSR